VRDSQTGVCSSSEGEGRAGQQDQEGAGQLGCTEVQRNGTLVFSPVVNIMC